jgi:hypothetical protein
MNARTPCSLCGAPCGIGDWPWCPHGRPSYGVHDDTLPGGARWLHNLDDRPVWVETKTQFTRELRSRDLQVADRGRHNTDDASPYATRTRLKPGKRDPFLGTAGIPS